MKLSVNIKGKEWMSKKKPKKKILQKCNEDVHLQRETLLQAQPVLHVKEFKALLQAGTSNFNKIGLLQELLEESGYHFCDRRFINDPINYFYY